jgi:hypothetical protein
VPKIPIWVHFGGSWNAKSWHMYFMTIWNMLWPFGIFYSRLAQFVVIRYIFCFADKVANIIIETKSVI